MAAILVTDAPPLVSFVAVIVPNEDGVVKLPSGATAPPIRFAIVQSKAARELIVVVIVCFALHPVTLSILSICIVNEPAVFFDVNVTSLLVISILVSKNAPFEFKTMSLKSEVVPVK